MNELQSTKKQGVKEIPINRSGSHVLPLWQSGKKVSPEYGVEGSLPRRINQKHTLLKRVFDARELYLFLLPAVVIIIAFNYIPMYGVQIAFRNFKPSLGISGSEWVGFKHYYRLFNLPLLWSIVKNTFSLSLLSIALGFPVPILLALFLNQIQNQRYKRVLQTVTYLPHFISTVVIVGMILVFLSPRAGLYGIIMRFFGHEPANLMGKADLFAPIYVLSGVWKSSGWGSIIYLAALSAIDPTLYEAAVIDGANRWQKIIHIDIPSLTQTMTILLILTAGTVLGIGFEKVYLMQTASNIARSEVISTYVYKVGIQQAQFSFATALGLLNSVVNFAMLFFVNVYARRVGNVSLW